MAAGLTITQSTSNGNGVSITGNGTGAGMLVTSGSGSSANAIHLTSAGTDGHGLYAIGNGSGEGIHGQGGVTGGGIMGLGGASAGDGIAGYAQVNTYGGIHAYHGGTGNGLLIAGGSTAGNAVQIVTTSGHGINIAPVGTNMHGINVAGGNGGTSDALKLTAGTGGVGLRLDTLTASGAVTLSSTLTISGTTSLAAVSTSGTVTMNALTVSNATTLSGAVSMGSTLGITGAITATSASNDIRGVSLSSTGLNNIIPVDPATTEPTFAGNSTIVQWIAYFGAWSVNPVTCTSSQLKLKNTAGSSDLVTHAVSDDGTTFTSGGAT